MAQERGKKLFVSVLASLCLSTFPAQAEEGEGDGGFAYGSGCAQLAQFGQREILAIVHSVHADHYGNFCKPEGIYSCDDYSALLNGAGALEENGSSGCRYMPAGY